MPKGKNATAFDEILTSFSDPQDRQTLEALAERNPKLNEYGLRQDEFSKRLNEVKGDLDDLEKWRGWRANSWDDTRSMTKSEIAAIDRAEALEREKAELENKIAFAGLGTGDDVASFEEIEKLLDGEITKRGLVTREAMEAEKKTVEGLIIGTNSHFAEAAMEVPYLNRKHEQEFGQMFDPKDFLNQAREAGAFGKLRDFYDKNYSVAQREAKMKGDFETRIQKAEEEKNAAVKDAEERGRQFREREVAMAQNPGDQGGPSMGRFQEKYLGLKSKEEAASAPDVPLGEGGIAAFAAREFIQKSSTNR